MIPNQSPKQPRLTPSKSQPSNDQARQVQARNAQLQRALQFEATLKRITDRVRDSLDESQILQAAVQELAVALDASCCNAALYDSAQGSSTVRYEYTTSATEYQGRILEMSHYPEIYQQLLQGQCCQFCSLSSHPDRGLVAMFAFPLKNDQPTVGDLWLITAKDRVLNEQEVRLIQQVTNQCVIALRQAQLYQTAQAHISELETLNRLKDDFLSTVSHEIRTPLSNIRLSIQMLELRLQQGVMDYGETAQLNANFTKCFSYLQILKDECEREIELVNNLLDLQQIEAGDQPPEQIEIHLQEWIPNLVEPFEARTRARQQSLHISLAPNLPLLISDPSQLRRVLAELLNNACKYTPPEGSILLRGAVVQGMLQLQVSNSSIEIPAQALNHIFDKFYRIPSGNRWGQSGTGLGLALVKGLVARLSGSIQVESTAGWTCFTVNLPLA